MAIIDYDFLKDSIYNYNIIMHNEQEDTITLLNIINNDKSYYMNLCLTSKPGYYSFSSKDDNNNDVYKFYRPVIKEKDNKEYIRFSEQNYKIEIDFFNNESLVQTLVGNKENSNWIYNEKKISTNILSSSLNYPSLNYLSSSDCRFKTENNDKFNIYKFNYNTWNDINLDKYYIKFYRSHLVDDIQSYYKNFLSDSSERININAITSSNQNNNDGNKIPFILITKCENESNKSLTNYFYINKNGNLIENVLSANDNHYYLGYTSEYDSKQIKSLPSIDLYEDKATIHCYKGTNALLNLILLKQSDNEINTNELIKDENENYLIDHQIVGLAINIENKSYNIFDINTQNIYPIPSINLNNLWKCRLKLIDSSDEQYQLDFDINFTGLIDDYNFSCVIITYLNGVKDNIVKNLTLRIQNNLTCYDKGNEKIKSGIFITDYSGKDNILITQFDSDYQLWFKKSSGLAQILIPPQFTFSNYTNNWNGDINLSTYNPNVYSIKVKLNDEVNYYQGYSLFYLTDVYKILENDCVPFEFIRKNFISSNSSEDDITNTYQKLNREMNLINDNNEILKLYFKDRNLNYSYGNYNGYFKTFKQTFHDNDFTDFTLCSDDYELKFTKSNNFTIVDSFYNIWKIINKGYENTIYQLYDDSYDIEQMKESNYNSNKDLFYRSHLVENFFEFENRVINTKYNDLYTKFFYYNRFMYSSEVRNENNTFYGNLSYYEILNNQINLIIKDSIGIYCYFNLRTLIGQNEDDNKITTNTVIKRDIYSIENKFYYGYVEDCGNLDIIDLTNLYNNAFDKYYSFEQIQNSVYMDRDDELKSFNVDLFNNLKNGSMLTGIMNVVNKDEINLKAIFVMYFKSNNKLDLHLYKKDDLNIIDVCKINNISYDINDLYFFINYEAISNKYLKTINLENKSICLFYDDCINSKGYSLENLNLIFKYTNSNIIKLFPSGISFNKKDNYYNNNSTYGEIPIYINKDIVKYYGYSTIELKKLIIEPKQNNKILSFYSNYQENKTVNTDGLYDLDESLKNKSFKNGEKVMGFLIIYKIGDHTFNDYYKVVFMNENNNSYQYKVFSITTNYGLTYSYEINVNMRIIIDNNIICAYKQINKLLFRFDLEQKEFYMSDCTYNSYNGDFTLNGIYYKN